MTRGIGKYQIETAQESRLKILRALSSGEWVRYRDVVVRAGVGTTTASKFLKLLEKAGEVEKKVDLESGEYPYPVLYRLTPKGMEVLKAVKRRKMAEEAQPYDIVKSVREKIRDRIEKTIRYMAPKLEAKRGGLSPKLKSLLAMYATAATLGFFHPNFKDASERLKVFSDGLAEGLEIAVNPPIQGSDEDEALGEAVLEFLSHLFKSRGYREKVAKKGKLTVFFTLDLTKIDFSSKEKSDALFWGLVFEGLHREGKT